LELADELRDSFHRKHKMPDKVNGAARVRASSEASVGPEVEKPHEPRVVPRQHAVAQQNPFRDQDEIPQGPQDELSALAQAPVIDAVPR
jgi:hypothetical protein